MPWLLDGNNLAGGHERERVRRAALALARRERVRIVVYFDGAPPPGGKDVEELGRVEVRYVRHADSAIIDALRRSGRGWRLATDDRALGVRARDAGAQVVAAAVFWEAVESRAAIGRAEESDSQRAATGLAFFADATQRLPASPRRIRRRRRRRQPPRDQG
jgi:hypothetical protein